MTPANVVTAVRGVGALLCAALVGVDLLDHPSSASWILAVVAAPTLLLDIVDGQVARRTGTVSEFGGQFDMEVDAFMVGVVSVHAAMAAHPPAIAVLALFVGAMRYLLAVATWWRGTWRNPVSPRPFRKIVAASVAALLWVTTTPVTPSMVTALCVVVSFALLTWSFGTQIVELESRSRLSTPDQRQAPEHRQGILHGSP